VHKSGTVVFFRGFAP